MVSTWPCLINERKAPALENIKRFINVIFASTKSEIKSKVERMTYNDSD